MPDIEIINSNYPRGPFRIALWDFDGTLSLYRGGWQKVMVEMMVGELAATGTSESPSELHTIVTEFVVALTGAPTIHQMVRLAEEVQSRRGSPRTPAEYGLAFQDQLVAVVNHRMGEVQRGEKQPLEHGVPGAEPMLAALAQRGVQLVLASGTEREHVVRELNALGLAHYFGDRIFAPRDSHDKEFSKGRVIDRLLAENNATGTELISFGDGMVETAETKRVGGCAVGVASDESGGTGPDAEKRAKLIQTGADLIVPNFLAGKQLLQLFRV